MLFYFIVIVILFYLLVVNELLSTFLMFKPFIVKRFRAFGEGAIKIFVIIIYYY